MGRIVSALREWVHEEERRAIGEIAIAISNEGYRLTHRADSDQDLMIYDDPEAAREIAKYDKEGKYRPLKTAPSLPKGWCLELTSAEELRRALDFFYPAALGNYLAFRNGELPITPAKGTFDRQTGMYRITRKMSCTQTQELTEGFCKSAGGCLRTIMWKIDRDEPVKSHAPSKFDPEVDQFGGDRRVIPLLCPEVCNLFVAAARRYLKPESSETGE